MCGFYRLWYKTSISKFLKSIFLRLGLARRWHSPRSTTPKKVHLSACHLRSDKRNRGCNRKLQCSVLGCINKSSVACSPLPEKGRKGQVLVCNKTHLTSSENRSHESKNQRLSTIIRIQFSNAHIRPDSNQSINLRDLYAETGKLYKARSRLYRSQILHVNTRWKALAEIYTMHSFAPLSKLKIFVKRL